MAEIIIRPGESSDHALILDSFWERYHNSHYAYGAPSAVLKTLMRSLLARWKVSVACDPSERDEVLGYVVWRDPKTIAWIHVQARYRRRGTARALLTSIGAPLGGEVATPFMSTATVDKGSPPFTKLAESKGYTVRFRPLVAVAELLDATAPA